MLTANGRLRETMRAKNVPLWKLARELGVHEITLQRWLRLELDKEHSERVYDALNKIIAGDK